MVRDGYNVSFDIDTLRNGDFDTQLLSRIDQCKDFILIVDEHAFDRTIDPNFDPKKDWLRCELAYALKKNKNIIPVFLAGVNGFPKSLPSDVAGVSKKNGPEYNRYYFNDFYRVLKKRFIHSKRTLFSQNLFSHSLFICVIVGLFITYYGRNEKKIEEENTPPQNEHVADTVSSDLAKEKLKDNQDYEKVLDTFTGYFQYIETQSIMWNLALNPKEKNISLAIEDIHKEVFEDCTNINNAIGYIGTDFHSPEYWEITSFNLSSDKSSAMIELIMNFSESEHPTLSRCRCKLEKDEYGNLIVSFVEGNYIPWILGSTEFNNDITFIRQQ